MLSRRFVSVLTVALPALAGLASAPAQAQNRYSLYPDGPSWRSAEPGASTGETDLGSGLTPRKPRWSQDMFDTAPLQGLRVTRSFEKYPGWGLAFDFSHRSPALNDRTQSVGGNWPTVSGSMNSRMSGYVQNFELSPGASSVSMAGVYRWESPGLFDGKLQPYVRAGLDYYLPYRSGTDTPQNQANYDSAGFGFHLQGGVEYRLSRQWGLFAGAKFNGGTPAANPLANRVDPTSRNFQVVGGANYDF